MSAPVDDRKQGKVDDTPSSQLYDQALDDDNGSDSNDGDGHAVKDDGSPVTAADWANLQEALRKARKDARAAKRAPAPGNNGSGTGNGSDAPSGSGGGLEPDKLEEVRSATESKWKGLLVSTAARTAFVEAGLSLPKTDSDAAMSKVVRLLDLSEVEVNEDGQIEGLHEQVEDIKRDFPELFSTARRVARVDGADRSQPSTKQATTAEKIASRFLGR